MASKKITMVDQSQIAKKGYKGCKSTRAVQNFCAKNKSSIDCCWYKPKGCSEKVLLIEMSSFRDCWKASQKSTSMTAKSSTGTRRTTTKATSRTRSASAKTRSTRMTKMSAKSSTRSTTSRTKKAMPARTRTTRLRRAA